MTEPRELIFTEDWAEAAFFGQPLIESVLRAYVGRCQECGRRPEAQREGSMLINPLLLDGTLYGDTFCLGCHDGEVDGLAFLLPPLDEVNTKRRED